MDNVKVSGDIGVVYLRTIFNSIGLSIEEAEKISKELPIEIEKAKQLEYERDKEIYERLKEKFSDK